MTPAGALLLAGSGLVAGTVNTIAGAGSLLTFPVLLGAGLSVRWRPTSPTASG